MYKLFPSIFIFIVLFVHISSKRSLAQQNYLVTQYGKENGLPSELVKSMAFDSSGFIWMATDEGLIRFNGFKFKQYKKELPSPYVKSVLYSSSRRLFATTDLGFIEIFTRPNSASFRTIIEGRTSETDSLLWFPKMLYEDKKGNIWFSDNTAVYLYNGDIIERIQLPKKNHSYNWQRACSFAENTNGELFIFSEPGFIYNYDYSRNTLHEIGLSKPLGAINHAINISGDEFLISASHKTLVAQITGSKFKIITQKPKTDFSYFLADGKTIWAGSWSKGIFQLSWQNNILKKKHIAEYNFKAANFLYANQNKEIWVASDHGITLMQPQVFSGELQSVTDQYIQDLEFLKGETWFSDGKHVFLFNKTKKTKTVARIEDHTLIQLLPKENGFWYTDNKANLHFQPSNGKRNSFNLSRYGGTVFSVTEWNGLWLCQDNNPNLLKFQDGNIQEYQLAPKGISRPIVTVKSPDEQLYLGAVGDSSYFFRYDAKTDIFLNISHPIKEEHSDALILNDIVFGDSCNCIWLGTSIGLYYYTSKSIKRVDLGEMSQESVKALSIDNKGQLWIANSKGLVRYRNGEYVVFDERTGLLSKTIAYRMLKCDKENWIWTGTVAGLNFASNIAKADSTPKPVFLSIENDRKAVLPQTQKDFLSNTFFRVEFISPSFPSQTLNYLWRIQGIDTAWKSTTHFNDLHFSNLKPGNYALQIKALQAGNHTWSSISEFNFNIILPWYKRKPIWLLGVATLAGLVALIVKINTKQLAKEKMQLEVMVAKRTAEIQKSKDKLEQSEQQLKASTRELEEALSILETTNHYLQSQTRALNTSAIVSMSDAEGYITFANDNFCKLSGYSRNELIGNNHRILKSGVHSASFYKDLWETLQTSKWRGEICNRNKNGKLYWVDTTIVPFMTEDGKPYQFLSVRFDITEQKWIENELREKNKEIFEGIHYASFIQNILMTPPSLDDTEMLDRFILYLPRDIISGDFYWIKRLDSKVLWAVADCTGHGVPGAMMSMLGMAFMNEISNLQPDMNPGLFLENLRELVKSSLHQNDFQSDQNDGMDLALCIYDLETKELQFSGANLPLYIVTNGTLKEFLGTPNPIGVYRKETEFKVHRIQLEKSACLYMFSDGFVDQFGGLNDQKYMTKRFKQLLTQNAHKDMSEQKNILLNEFNQWKGQNKQIDDILVMGVRFD